MPIGFLRPFPAVVLVIVATALVLPISFVVPIVEKNLTFVKLTPPP